MPLFQNNNDFIVQVPETKLDFEHQHYVLPVLHSFIMYYPKVIKITKEFFKKGTDD